MRQLLLITFRHFYYGKYMFLTSLIWIIFFRFLLYRELGTEILIILNFQLQLYT